MQKQFTKIIKVTNKNIIEKIIKILLKNHLKKLKTKNQLKRRKKRYKNTNLQK